jgi:hypothetical protein
LNSFNHSAASALFNSIHSGLDFPLFFPFLFQSFPCPLTMFETLKFLLVSVKVDDHKSHLTIHLKTVAAFLSHPNHFYTSFFFPGDPLCVLLEWAGTAFLFSKSF